MSEVAAPVFDPAMSLEAAGRRLRDALRAAGIDTADIDARMLLEHASGLDRTGVVRAGADPIGAGPAERLQDAARRRLAGEPVQRIMGEAEFWGLTLLLSAATLVPRPDTETVVDAVLAAFPDHAAPIRVADLGTGSGAILAAILSEYPNALGLAVDLSGEALATAAANFERLGLSGRVRTARQSFAEPFAPEILDLVVSNPPYIETATLAGLDREVREHDPALALDGGADGLDAYRALAPTAFAALRPGGRIMLEVGLGQALDVSRILAARGFREPAVRADLAGHDRVVIARKPFPRQ